MEHSTFNPLMWITIAAAVMAAALIVYYLLRRPPLNGPTKLLLLAAIGAFPATAGLTGNIAGFEATTSREFCGGCHVMTPYVDDLKDPRSASLASMHGRNHLFGERACYTCHADYGMFGVVATKIGGMRHVYHYYLSGYHKMSLDESREKIHIAKPFPNSTCTHCHSTRLAGFQEEPEHAAMLESLDRDVVSCASEGCHGPAHPFSKGAKR
jgi:cytochrome c-type protein NapC